MQKEEWRMEEVFHLGGAVDDRIVPQYGRNGHAITVPAEEEAIDLTQDFIEDKLRLYGFDVKTMGQIRLAVEEIFVNICSYAYRPKTADSKITCDIAMGEKGVSIDFEDTGMPFNPVERPEADLSEEAFLAREGGLGIHLVKNLMDDVSYRYENGKNILRIRKNK